MIRLTLCLLALLGIQASLYSTIPLSEGEPLTVSIQTGDFDNEINFTVENPPSLPQSTKDSLPYWSFFWEFGDGTFQSVDKSAEVRHVYPEVDSAGSFTARVFLTPRYTTISQKPIKSELLSVNIINNGIGWAERIDPPTIENFVELVPNQEPAFGHEVRFALQYQQPKEVPDSKGGHIVLLFNEAAFELTPPFEFESESAQIHHGEKTKGKSAFKREENIDQGIRTSLLSQYGASFSEMKVWRYDDFTEEAHRNIFFSLQTADTVRELETDRFSIIAILVPDSMTADSFQIEDLEESPYFSRYEAEIKRSLDPNHISVNMVMMLSNPVDKRLEYRVDFQNIGEASATTVSVAVNWPSYFDKNSIEIIEYTPELRSDQQKLELSHVFETDKKKENIVFYFREIELRGTNEEPKPIKKLTKGHVIFSVKIDETIIEKKYDKNDLIKSYSLPSKIAARAYITFYGHTGKEDSLKTNRTYTALTMRRRYLSVGRNFVGQDINTIISTNPFTTGFINNATFGYGRTFAQVNKLSFNWDLQYNAFYTPQINATNVDSLQLGNLDLSFGAHYSFGVPVIGLFKLGLGVGGTGILYANQGGEADYRFWQFSSEPESSQYDPWGLLGYVELNKSFLRKTLELSVRYSTRYYPQIAGQKAVMISYPQVILSYRLADSKADFLESLNQEANPKQLKSVRKKEKKQAKKDAKKKKKK